MSGESIMEMIERTSTYQDILMKGAVRQARKLLLLLGRERFGKPPNSVFVLVDLIDDLRWLDELTLRLLHVDDWEALFEESLPPTP